MVSTSSSLCTQEPAIGPYPEPVESSSHYHKLFKIYFNTTLLSTPSSPKWSIPFKFHTSACVLHAPSISSPLHDHPRNILWKIQTVNLSSDNRSTYFSDTFTIGMNREGSCCFKFYAAIILKNMWRNMKSSDTFCYRPILELNILWIQDTKDRFLVTCHVHGALSYETLNKDTQSFHHHHHNPNHHHYHHHQLQV